MKDMFTWDLKADPEANNGKNWSRGPEPEVKLRNPREEPFFGYKTQRQRWDFWFVSGMSKTELFKS